MTTWLDWVRYVRDECNDVPPDVHHFLLVLATFADAQGRCWPSQDRLAAILKISRWAVRRRRDAAKRLGWINYVSGQWRGAPTRYRLLRKGATERTLSRTERVHPEHEKRVRAEHEERVRSGRTRSIQELPIRDTPPQSAADNSHSDAMPRGEEDPDGADRLRRTLGYLADTGRVTDPEATAIFADHGLRGFAASDLAALEERFGLAARAR